MRDYLSDDFHNLSKEELAFPRKEKSINELYDCHSTIIHMWMALVASLNQLQDMGKEFEEDYFTVKFLVFTTITERICVSLDKIIYVLWPEKTFRKHFKEF